MDVLTPLVFIALMIGLLWVTVREADRRRQREHDRAMRQLKDLNDAHRERRETVHFPPRDLPTLEDFRARAHRGTR